MSDTLSRPHPLVRTTRDLMKGRGPRDELVSGRSSACLDIYVARGTLSRALRIMDALLKTLGEQGYQVEVTEPKSLVGYYGSPRIEPSVTRVCVEGEWVAFALSEKRTTVKTHERSPGSSYTWTRTEYVPTGALSLAITNASYLGLRTTWNDGKRQRVEGCLDDFIDYLPEVAGRLRAQRLAAEKRAEEERERRRRWEEQEKRRLAEERRRDELLEALERWRLARDIRAYVSEARSRGGAHLEEHLNWAAAYAGSLDPLSSSDRED